jgi:hypothetical protein
MDTNEMVIKPEPRIEEGKELVKALDKEGLYPEVALWFYLAESNNWRFILSSSSFPKSGQNIYSDFIDKYRDLPQIKAIRLENITLLPGTDNLISMLKTAVKTNSRDIDNIRFTSNVINGVLIEDALIYRLS